MKNWQFIVICCCLIIQTIFLYPKTNNPLETSHQITDQQITNKQLEEIKIYLENILKDTGGEAMGKESIKLYLDGLDGNIGDMTSTLQDISITLQNILINLNNK